MTTAMLLALLVVAFRLPAQTAPPAGVTVRPALPALAAKAPGAPAYGLHISAPQGQFIFTNLRYTEASLAGTATCYRVTGPAGMGPYRMGLQLSYRPKFLREVNGQKWYTEVFYAIDKALEGGAAKEAGLDEDWSILKVDGQDFGWNLNALIAHLTTHASVEVLALKRKGWGAGTKQKTFTIALKRTEGPADPADGTLVPESVEALKPMLGEPGTWSELLRQRSALPRFAAVPVDLPEGRVWAVRGVPNPHPGTDAEKGRTYLELWREDPASTPKTNHPEAVVTEPPDGLRTGRALSFRGRWLRLQEAAVDPRTGQLLKLGLTPWSADIPSLLSGRALGRDLGPGGSLTAQENLENLGNEALIEWKTRTLPGLLTSQELVATEDLVIRLEKGLLALDLEVKGIRTRLDAAARAEAERKAQAELAAKEGKPAPAAAAPATESERLADLLDQRKAILMAVLGSAKQALANLRR